MEFIRACSVKPLKGVDVIRISNFIASYKLKYSVSLSSVLQIGQAIMLPMINAVIRNTNC